MPKNNKIRGYSARKSAAFNRFLVGPIRAVMGMNLNNSSLEFTKCEKDYQQRKEEEEEEEGKTE